MLKAKVFGSISPGGRSDSSRRSLPVSIDQRYSLENGEEIICLEVVRSLPGKRQVFLGEYAGSQVFVKLFLDSNRGGRHWRRECDGLIAFKQRNIRTAEVLYAGQTADQHLPVIVLEHISGVKSVKQAWGEADIQSQKQILKRMVVLLAQHHQSGLCQTDLHLDNFVMSDQEIFSLDGAGVVVHAGGVGQETGLRNLGLFVAQLPPEWEAHIPEISELYSTQRGWSHGPGSASLLIHVNKAREGRWKEFSNKLFRNCTAFLYTKHHNGFQVVAREFSSQEMTDLLHNPDASFPGANKALKNGNTSTVWAIAVNGHDVVVKRYNVKGFWHGLKLSLFTGRGERSWVNGYRLLFCGIPTPRPVALLKMRAGLFSTTVYLLSELVQFVSAKKLFRDPGVSDGEKEAMAEQIAQTLHKLQQQQISHGDLKASNILISDGEAMLIDLDAMRQHADSAGFKKAWTMDLQRFMRNWDYDKELHQLFIRHLISNRIDLAGLGFE
jgi:tRNA A-37 threonylcarbamoyl transferase component Bud32